MQTRPTRSTERYILQNRLTRAFAHPIYKQGNYQRTNFPSAVRRTKHHASGHQSAPSDADWRQSRPPRSSKKNKAQAQNEMPRLAQARCGMKPAGLAWPLAAAPNGNGLPIAKTRASGTNLRAAAIKSRFQASARKPSAAPQLSAHFRLYGIQMR